MQLSFQLDAFEGPMDLLLHLIEKNELNIYDIPIAMLTEQYIQHLEHIRTIKDMASLSEFLVMAATLLEIKSRMLLPVAPKELDGTEVDPREELMLRLIEYKKYKRITAAFAEKELIGERYVFRTPDTEMLARIRSDIDADLTEVLEGINLSLLLKACHETISRREISADKPEISFETTLARDTYTVEDRINHVTKLLLENSSILFTSLISSATSPALLRSEIVITFIAILELTKQLKVTILQDTTFGDITITSTGNLDYPEDSEDGEIL